MTMIQVVKRLIGIHWIYYWLLSRYHARLNRRVFNITKMIKISHSTSALRAKINRETRNCLSADDNKGFFSDAVKRYGHRDWALPFKSDFALYAPNIAVIDFLLEHIKDPDSETILDYACGLGYLLTYLRELGFTNLYGYDNFQQVRERSIRCFLRSFGLEDSLIADRSKVREINPTIMCIIGIPYNWLDLDIIEFLLEKDSLKFVLLDALYCRSFRHPNYQLLKRYHGLLNVYEKIRSEEQ